MNIKKLLAYMLIVVATAVSVYFIYGYVQSSRYDPTAVPYINQALPQLSRWDLDATKELLDEDALARVTDERLTQMLEYLARIGELEDFERPRFKSTSTAMTTGAIERTVITYSVAARYSSGDAEVTLSLLDRDGAYSLLHFNFSSQALAP